MGAGASRYGADLQYQLGMNELGAGLPLRYAQLLGPTYTQGSSWDPVETGSGSRSSGKQMGK
jgi:hypothetical protein